MPAPTPKPPFGLSAVLPAFDRATRLARTLLDASHANIVLIEGERIWRSREPNVAFPRRAPAADYAMQTGELLWLEDATLDPRFNPADLISDDFRTAFYAAAPVRLSDGSTPGVLAVFDRKPRAFDRKLAARLMDLADSVADECDRARATEAAAKSAAELAKAHAVMDALVEVSPVSWALTDLNFCMVNASPRWIEIFAPGGQDYRGRSIFDLAPQQFSELRSRFEDCLAGRSAAPTRLRLDRSGEPQWLQTEFTAWSLAGKTAGVTVTSHDVTELIQAVEKAERSEQRLQLALELADIYVTDLDFERRTLQMAGAAAPYAQRLGTFESLSKDIFGAVDPRDREDVKRAWRRHVKEGAPYNPEYRVDRSDGREIWTNTVARSFVNDAGRITRVIAAGQNVTERRRAQVALLEAKEEAETANRAKSTFLATMSHEIRTPLNGVLGMAQAMAMDRLAPRQRERLDIIRRSGETLLAILNDVLDLSKIEAGKLELETVEFDLDELVRSVHDVFAHMAEAKGCAFVSMVDPVASGIYRGDPTRVRQILYNLVSNALKFTDAGEVGLNATMTPEGLVLRVKDTGIGMSAEHLATLYRKFQQADASTTRRFGGTGLGLAICHELVTLMGGSISAESRPGEGAVFMVILPLPRICTATPRAEEPKTAAVQDFAETPLRVLAAEDNAVNQLVLKALLKQAGVEPRIVVNGLEAVAAWEAEEWDVILMDVHMPQMDGPAATRIIRTREQASGRGRTPIIALTANTLSHQIAEYSAAGMDDFVGKPIEIGRLYAALEAVLTPAATGSQDRIAG